ncbi:MAG: DNA polymerase IV [Clostridiales bacterium]|jgi:DNA polymerase-4|nr:DNA polymerase IV [Clostridiales bacterium]
MSKRVVLHADANSFYASVECVLNPEYAKVPMAVAGSADMRHGIILAKNELAKGFGVKTAETIWQARRKCPNLVLTPPRHHIYAEFSNRINEIYEQYSDLCERFGIDETFIDVTNVRHLFGDGKAIADTLRERIKKEIGLTISVGVSFNKVFAKLGSDYKKPDATTVITAGNFRSIVWPLPVNNLLFVGRAAGKALEAMGIRVIDDLANCDKAAIARKLGKAGEVIHDYANGLDESPVAPAHEHHGIKSVGNGMTFRRDLLGYDDISAAVAMLSDEVSGRMRKHSLKCRTVSIMIKTPDFKTITRQATLERPTNFLKELRDTAMTIIAESWNINEPIRMLTITGNNLVGGDEAVEQMSLFEDAKETEKQGRLNAAMDDIRARFGENALKFGMPVVKDLWSSDA